MSLGKVNTKSPLPSTLVFISQLNARPHGDKVRFLGCVNNYDEKSASLELFHHFPKNNKSPSKVFVSIDAILDTLKNQDLQVGSWLNVIGYVIPSQTISSHLASVTVQAVMIWSAGSINLGDYEIALKERQIVGC